jgi:hypothetical protein
MHACDPIRVGRQGDAGVGDIVFRAVVSRELGKDILLINEIKNE